MAISVYTDMDSLFDSRRGIITKVAIESGNTEFDWEKNFSEIYNRRKMDYFHQPELGVTQEKYLSRFDKRSIDDFADSTQAYIRPSRLIGSMFRVIREYEFGVGQMLSMDKFNLTVNLYPYILSDTLKEELEKVLRGSLSFNIGLTFVYKEYDVLIPSYLHGFDYVFVYGFLNSKYYKAYWERYGTTQNTKTKFIVPAILNTDNIPEEMSGDDPATLIDKFNATQGGQVTWIPVDKIIYSYKE